MQAIVLVGGEGTRLRPLTLTHPKPAVRLVDRPFIRFMVDWLARHEVDEVVMACGFRAELLREALGRAAPAPGRSIRYLEEPEPLGTAGPLRLAADRGLLDERFLALNGDVLTDLDLGALIRAHERTGRSPRWRSIPWPTRPPTAWFAARAGRRPRAHRRSGLGGRCGSSSRSPTRPRSTPTRSTPAPTCSSAAFAS